MDETMECEETVNDNSNETVTINQNNGVLNEAEVLDNKINSKQNNSQDIENELNSEDTTSPIEAISSSNSSNLNSDKTSIDADNSEKVESPDSSSVENHNNVTECNITNNIDEKSEDSDKVNDVENQCEESNKSKDTNSKEASPKAASEEITTSDEVDIVNDAEKTSDDHSESKNESKDEKDIEVDNVDETEKSKEASDTKEVSDSKEVADSNEVSDSKEVADSKEVSDSPEVSKKKEESGKKKKGKTCVECGKKKKIEFRIHFQGKVHALCSETCYKQFKEKQSAPKPQPESPPKAEEPAGNSFCPECQKLIFPNQGYYPVVGEVKPLCSEDCVRKYQDSNGPPRKCSQCEKKVEDKSCHLTWETMVFCSEDCLGKYQSFLGSHCTCCQAPVQQSSLGKYCVCFGSDIRQFCSGSCLDDFKKGLKVCTFCQTDLSAGSEGFLAPVGDKGQFKDFCSQACMERYETMNNRTKSAPEVQECGHCKKQGSFKIQIVLKDEKYFLCCDNCVAGLRCTLKKKDNVCSSCHSFFDCSNDLNGNKQIDFKLKLDGLYKFFCSKTCMTTYVLSHRRITQCLFCKVKKYNFDMIEKADGSATPQTFCSLNCLSLFRVNVNAASSKSIRCDNCSKTSPAQYHLTMSDGSIRNFCTYNCVLAFQNQFTSVPALTTTSMTRQMTTPVQTIKTSQAVSAPVIANVVSLAQARTGAPTLTKTLVPQALVSVRPSRQPVAVFTTKPQVSTTTATSMSVPVGHTNAGPGQIMREVIVQPPAPKSVKNKTVWCKPIMLTKGINAKTPACHKAVQTDDNPRPVIFPVPVPVYVPTPLHMFSRPVPCPVPFPVPIPIPVLIPSSKDSQNQILKHFRQIQNNLSSKSSDNEMSAISIEKSTDGSDKTLSDSVSLSFLNDTKCSKRLRSPSDDGSSKKARLNNESASTSIDDNDDSSSPFQSTSFPPSSLQPDSSPQSNSHFETPSFSFEDDDPQPMLKVP